MPAKDAGRGLIQDRLPYNVQAYIPGDFSRSPTSGPKRAMLVLTEPFHWLAQERSLSRRVLTNDRRQAPLFRSQ